MPRPTPDSAQYGAFAWFYNRYWSEDFHRLAFPILERIWLGSVPPGGRILDVCCGTGYLAGLLLERGYTVTGIDISPEMIGHARENAPGAEFHLVDAAGFELPPCHNAAVSTFDSLNHILSLDALQRAFRNTAAALRPGALFTFDMLLEEAYMTHWGEAFALVEPDHVLTITGASFDARRKTAACTITMFRLLEGVWQRSDVVARERCYSPHVIDAALVAAGFGEINCYAAHDLGMAGELGIGRTFYVATRL
jgi:SAM-dependent methyltransferase